MKLVVTNTLKGLYLILLASILYGCGSDEESSGPNSNYLTGTWTQDCVYNGGTSNTYTRTILDFENTSSITITENTYGDDTCFFDLLDTYTLAGTYTLGGDVLTTTGETATAINVTMFQEDGVTIPEAARRTGYRIVYVDGNNLYGGDEEADPNLDGTTAAKRSNILETIPYVFATVELPPVTNSVVGTWVYSCYPYGTNSYSIETAVFTANNTVTLTDLVFSDSACTIPQGTDIAIGTYSLGATVTTTSGLGAMEIDLTVNTLNGITVPGGGITLYDIAYRDSMNLYHGEYTATLDATTSAKRPDTINFADIGVMQ